MATKPDYYMVTGETEERPNPWMWEIRRHSKPMPVRVFEKGFRSQMAAEFAGKRELAQFLKLLAEEEKRNAKPPQAP
jgi:hypothetical protein